MAPAAAMAKTRTNSTDWQTWFASPDAAAANQTLASTKAIAAKGAATAKLGAKTESELLGGLARRRRRLLLNSKGVEDLYAALEGATLDDLREYVAEHATVNVVEASEQWNRKRNVGWRRARTGFQRFAMSFDRFLSGFQGVVEIVKMADGQYGGMATQVLSILFATVKVKAANDEAIVGAMETIGDRLPEVAIYGKVYADAELGNMLAEAYKEVIVFAVQATQYFQQRGYFRALISIGRPQLFTTHHERLTQAFTSVRYRSEALLSQRVDVLREQNGALLAQLRLLLTRQDEDRARDVRRRWLRESHIRGLESGRPFDGACTRQDMSPDDGAGVDSSVVRHMASRLARHRALLAGIFGCATTTVGVLPPRQHGVMDEVENMDLDKLRTLPAYKAWSAPEAPASLWYVHGSNHSSLTLVDQCWFEGAIVDLVEWLRRGSGEKGSDDMQTVNSGEKEKTVVEEHATTGSDAPLDEKQPVSDNTNPVTSPTAPPSSPRRIVLPVLCTPHTTPTDVLKCALAQLLEQRPGLLRDAAAMHELESCVAPVVPEMNENPYAGERKLPRPPEDYSRALRGLLALLRRKVDSFADDLNGTDASDGDGTGAVGGKDIPSLPAPVDDVFIVLLRPEYCCDETVAGAKGRSTATTWRLLRTLLELVQDVENDVKADLTGGDVGSAVVVASEKSASPSSMASDKAVVRPDEVKMKNKEDKKTDDAGGAGACRLRVLFVAKRDLWDVEPRLGDLRAELREGSRLLVSALEQGVVDGGW